MSPLEEACDKPVANAILINLYRVKARNKDGLALK